MQLTGLRLDGKFADSPFGTWAYGKNILLSRGFDEIENEPGDSEYIATLSGHKLIGRITTPNEVILFTWDSTKTYIKKVSSTGVVTDLLTGGTTLLDYSPTTYPAIYIEGVYYYNASGELIIAWTTGYHKPMIMNTTTPVVLSTLKDLYLFAEFTHNNFTLTSGVITGNITNGGNLPAASYQLSLTYELETDVNTNFGGISNPIFITEDDNLTSYRQFKGNGSLIKTSKAIVVTLSELDTDYDYLKIAVIQRTETSTICYITKRVKISSSSLSVIIDDLNNLLLYNINEVITSSPAFSIIKTMTQANNRLRIGNLTKPTKLTLAQIYDNILTPRTLSCTASRSGTTVTVVCSAVHGLATGAIVTMNGWTPSAYDGHYVITVDNTTTFHYTTTSGTDSGTPGTCKTDILTVNWVCDTNASLYTTKDSYKDPIFIFNKRQFRSDEVYALYLGLKLKTGGYYGIYHIPGREALGTENSTQTTVDGTAIDDYKLTSSATKQGNYYGKMGLWENENETYGGNYGTNLGSSKVRHHRFPSAGQVNTFTSGYLSTTKKGTLVENLAWSGITYYEIGATDHLYVILPLSTTPALGTYTQADDSPLIYINTYTATYAQVLDLDFSLGIRLIDMTSAGASATVVITKYRKTPTGFTSSILKNQTQTTIALDETLTFTYSSDIELNAGDYITYQIDIQQLSTHAYAGTPGFTNSTTMAVYEATVGMPILGLRIALDWANVNGTIKTALEAVVDGWEIFYAKRSLHNQLMLDQSLAISDGVGYRFYGFDSMVNKLNIAPTHVKAQFNLQATDYADGAYIKEITNYTAQSAAYSVVTKIKYLPQYNSATVPNNENKENCYYLETISGSFDKRLVNLINIKDDIYLNFTNQELVSTGIIKRLQTTSAFSLYGGDCFINHNSVLTFVLSGVTYIPRIWYFPAENILNAGMRYEGENDYEKFFPATDITQLDDDSAMFHIVAMQDAGIANYYIYSSLYNIVNNIRQDNIDNELTEVNNLYPNRIYSSIPRPLESDSMYWRKFKILDYFDMINSKGAIYKMIGNEYVIYIQTDYSIFRGVVIDRLITGDIDVALKSSEMFDRPLQELHDADGNYIRPWNREGTILTPYGLIVADLNRGSIYQISDKATEISRIGIEDWFRDNIKNVFKFGTQEAIGTGVILGYDDLYKRLLVTLRNSNIAVTSAVRSGTGGITVTVTTTANHGLRTGDTIRMTGWNVSACNGVFIITVTGLQTFTYTTTVTTTGAITGGTLKTIDDFTLSFNFEKGYWVALHSYAPDKYMWNSNGMFYALESSGNTIFRKMFTGNFGYYNSTYYDSKIDFIFNNTKSERFLLKSVKWTASLEKANILYWDQPLTTLLIYSKNLCTEEITITKKYYGYNAITYILEETGNTLYKDGEWLFNDIKDYLTTPNSNILDGNFDLVSASLNLSKNWYDKSKFITKFAIIRFKYTNTSDNYKLHFSNLNIDIKNIL